MYKQSAFGRVKPRDVRVPENYSGNAFIRSEETVYEVEAEEREETVFAPSAPLLLPAKEESKPFSLDGMREKLSGETLILLTVLFLLFVGGGRKDDGAILAIILLLLL